MPRSDTSIAANDARARLGNARYAFLGFLHAINASPITDDELNDLIPHLRDTTSDLKAVVQALDGKLPDAGLDDVVLYLAGTLEALDQAML